MGLILQNQLEKALVKTKDYIDKKIEETPEICYLSDYGIPSYLALYSFNDKKFYLKDTSKISKLVNTVISNPNKIYVLPYTETGQGYISSLKVSSPAPNAAVFTFFANDNGVETEYSITVINGNNYITVSKQQYQKILKSGINIKTINGKSVLGEGNIIVEGGGGVAGGGIYEIKYDYVNGTPLSGEDIAFNKEVFDKLNKNEVSALYVTINIDNTPINIVADSFLYAQIPSDETYISAVYLNFNSDSLLVFGLSKKTVGMLSTGQGVEMPISSNIVDDEMSDTSENAVQNKVITEELNNKVDKVSGKQLSTEDFTTELKTRLEGMSSFDPTEINNKVNGLQTQIDTLVSGDTSTAIESFNEIANFLNGIEDTKSLEGIIAGIERQITNKQDTIADLDTIRSGATLGATALQEHQDISHLATKEELESLTNEMIANEEVHAAAYNDLDSRLKDVGSLISGVAVTKEEFQEGIQAITNEIIDNEEVNAAALNDLNERVNAIAENVSGETATKEELAAEVATINNVILENEEVHAAALNDLEERKADKTYVDEAIAQAIISTINANY